MPNITSEISCREWAEDKGKAWQRAISIRAALRAVPAFADTEEQIEFALSLFRALVLSWEQIKRPAKGRPDYVGVADHDAYKAADSLPRFRSGKAAMQAAAFAASAARDIAEDLDHQVGRVSGISADAAGPFHEDIWINLRQDAAWLEEHAKDRSDVSTLLARPLWPVSEPKAMRRAWESLAALLRQRDENWSIWIDWYERRLEGQASSFGLPSDIEEAFVSKIAFQTDAFWEREPALINADINSWLEKTAREPILPTELPQQRHGPYFQLYDGKVAQSPPEYLDIRKNNLNRLQSLQPLLQELCMRAVAVFGRNAEHHDVMQAVKDYDAAIAGDVARLNYDVIAGRGLILGHVEAAANRLIADRLRSEFEDNEKSALKALLDLHGSFILATEVGQSLIADAERYQRDAEQEKTLREDGAALIADAAAKDLMVAGDASFAQAAAEEAGLSPMPERSGLFGKRVVRNTAIVVVGGGIAAVIASLGVSAIRDGEIGAGLIGCGLAFITTEGLKKSDPFDAVAKSVAGLFNGAQQLDHYELAKYLPFAAFVLSNEARLRRIAGERREFRWLHEWLNWIKAYYKL